MLSKRTVSAALAGAVAAVLLIMVTGHVPASAAAQATYYVAPDGNDAGSGTLSSPFRTLQRARDVVRTVNANMTGDINVFLRGGRYPVTDTIEFTPRDSGTNGYRITYSAYQHETPVLDGGVPVSGWTQHSGNIWKAPLDRGNKLRSLYVNGKRALMATKTMNSAGCQGTYNITAGQADWAWESGSQCDGAKYSLSDFPAIALNQNDIEIESATTWTTAIVGVRQVTSDGANRVALFQQPGAAIAQGAFNGNFQPGGTHKVMNAYEFLDTPGEFYFDKTSKTVFYYKDGSEDMPTASVFAPNNVSTILKIAGTSTSADTRNITFSGLTIEHSDWNLTNVAGSAFKQAQQGNLSSFAYAKQNFHPYYYRNVDVAPGIIQIENADGIVLQRNRVQHTGVDGINMVNDVGNTKLIGNHTNDIAGSAITVGHPQHIYVGDHTATNREKYTAQVEGASHNIEIANNYLYDSAVLFSGHSPISAYFADTLSVHHNRIEKTPWAGITLGWGWWNFDGSANSVRPNVPTTTARNNTVSHNQLIDTMQRLHDSAPIYTLGHQPGTTISDNYIQGVPAGHKYGLHPDEGSAHITHNNNVLNIDRNVAYAINSGTWGRQHDLTITQTYGTLNKIFDRNVPNSTIQDVIVHSDGVWPLQAYDIAVKAGLEDAYSTVIPQSSLPLQDRVLPASTFTGPGTSSIPIRTVADATKTFWLAPAGTTTFTAGPTMTSASGTATSISVPTTPGDYRLYVLDAQGNRSAASTSLVRQPQGQPPNGTYKILNKNSGLAIDVDGGSTLDSAAVIQWTDNGAANQRWRASDTGSGAFTLTAVHSSRCMDVAGASQDNAAKVLQWTCGGGNNQKWRLEPTGSGTYRIISVNSNKCLDVPGSSTETGIQLIQWTCTTSPNQQWALVPVS